MTTPANLVPNPLGLPRASSENSPPATRPAQPTKNPSAGTKAGARPPSVHPPPIQSAAVGFLELRVWSEMFEDAQRARIACTNRAERGGVDPTIYTPQLKALAGAEHDIGLAMRKCFRRVAPDQHAWMLDTVGVGEHLLARLLGCIGDPRHATPHHWEGEGAKRVLVADDPFERTVSQLWAYCGHGDPERKKRKGMTVEDAFALGNPRAKMIVHLLAESCMKAVGSPANGVSPTNADPPVPADQNPQPSPEPMPIRPSAAANASGGDAMGGSSPNKRTPRRRSPYRDVYDYAKAKYADRTHATECVRCGPSGKPAQPGSPWSAGHQNAAALRLVGKEILRDLWSVTKPEDGP